MHYCPSTLDFLSLNFRWRFTFFGCDSSKANGEPLLSASPAPGPEDAGKDLQRTCASVKYAFTRSEEAMRINSRSFSIVIAVPSKRYYRNDSLHRGVYIGGVSVLARLIRNIEGAGVGESARASITVAATSRRRQEAR